MLRRIGATLAGMLLAFAVIVIVEMIGNALYPLPPGVDPKNPESIARAMRNVPAAALIVVVIGWTAGALLGSWLAARIARSVWPAVIVGALVVCGAVANMLTIPHPLWMWISSLVLVALVTLAGAGLGSRGRASS